MKDIIKPIAVLGTICLIVTALLAYIHSVTAPIISAAEQKTAQEARLEVMPAASIFDAVHGDLPEGVTEAFLCDNGGYVFQLTIRGYGGDIKLMCGVLDGKLTKIKTLSHNETSGIGSKVVSGDYGNSFIGKTESDYLSVDSVSGATISSTAYKKALETAFEAYDQLTKEATR
ncbi:MAG: FMN-binding protein [Ruminococcus sp.]|nr:FMN-binding protein [Ruminococcus sp.]